MHTISHVGVPPTFTSPQGASAGVQSGQSGGGTFQPIAMSQSSLASSSAQGVSAGVSRSLGSQMVSTLLQTQDLNQVQAQGHGGGHHGGMKMAVSLEAEEVAGDEEAQTLKSRKKLADKFETTSVSEADELDENGDPIKKDEKEQDEGQASLKEGA